jgi:hypothetical protein
MIGRVYLGALAVGLAALGSIDSGSEPKSSTEIELTPQEIETSAQGRSLPLVPISAKPSTVAAQVTRIDQRPSRYGVHPTHPALLSANQRRKLAPGRDVLSRRS